MKNLYKSEKTENVCESDGGCMDLDSKRFFSYRLEDYISDIEKNGLSNTWDSICQFVIDNRNNIPEFLAIKNFGELYEIGLAIQDKIAKKKSGQYYTPDDVALVMSEWLKECDGEAVCDVACGTGKLILTYLDLIGYEEARKLISSGNLYLYDFDGVALKICKTALSIKYGLDICDRIHDICGDFLDRRVKLPKNCKVIANPPYARLSKFEDSWEKTDILKDTSEFYSAFMEKIFSNARSTVIVTPFSFISGAKFYSLRKMMCDIGGGFIVAFDNVPGNIFCGRKHGIFNTNTANSVRAAITVLKKDSKEKGFRVSPLIRFKNDERKELLRTDVLESLLNDEIQVVDQNNKMFKKVFKELDGIFNDWKSKSQFTVKNMISKCETEYLIDMPNTCRYYTTGSHRKLSREGSITLFAKDKEAYSFLYCFINSSFTYWWWRIYDGAITYPSGLLMDMPIPFNLLSKEDKDYFSSICDEMSANEDRFIITKTNAGAVQENIKFPEEYREKINSRILAILNRSEDSSVFNVIHKNHFLGE